MSRKHTTRQQHTGWGAAIRKILPGDHIHDVAPISKQTAPTAVRLDAIDAAQAKRNRKNAKRKAEK